MRINIDDLPKIYQDQIQSQLSSAAASKDTSKDGESERSSCDALAKDPQDPKLSQRVYLVVLVYRTGIRYDLDNISFKPVLDGIVEQGYIADDSTRQIECVIKLARTVKTKAEERTELEFWDADYFSKYIESARRFRSE